jgi:hypothetical protein
MERTTLRDFTVDDVFGNFSEGTEAGFLLFVRNGTLIMLEGFTYGSDAWPSEPRLTDAYYMHHEPADIVMEAYELEGDYRYVVNFESGREAVFFENELISEQDRSRT